MREFVRVFVQKFDPDQKVFDEMLPLELAENLEASRVDDGEDSTDQNSEVAPKVLIQAEDFGRGYAMPFYGYQRPSSDYFNSNLTLNNFVIADVSSGNHKVLLYDERAQGKDANALCSLRMLHHLSKIGLGARVSLSILDNCVGQNKSNSVMKFFSLLSLLFYEKVVLVYLIPGHSHMVADRVVAWCKNKVRGLNIYHPQDMAKKFGDVKNVEATFFDHNDPKRPFFVGWESLLNKYFLNMPPGFTGSYFLRHLPIAHMNQLAVTWVTKYKISPARN
jgi:hypothetical protein